MIALLIFSAYSPLFAEASASPVCLVEGVGLSALFLRGHYALLGIALGVALRCALEKIAFPALLFQSISLPLLLYGIFLYTIRRIHPLPFERLSTFWHFVACLLFSHLAYNMLLAQWVTHSLAFWYLLGLGQINGILCVTAICLSCDPFTSARYFNKPQRWSLWCAFSFAYAALFYLPAVPSVLLSGLLGLLMVYYARRFGAFPTAITLIIIALFYLAGQLPYPHLFQVRFSTTESILLLSLFSATLFISFSITSLLPPVSKSRLEAE